MSRSSLIGRWRMTALVVNCIIGSAIFGVPGDAIRIVGSKSPLAILIAAAAMAIVMLPIVEVASQFSQAGGVYVYARAAFGGFVGLQAGWFWLLSSIAGSAACAALFLTYLSKYVPETASGPYRALALLFLIAVPGAANCLGVRQGANLTVLFTIAKASPLAILIVFGLLHPATAHTHATVAQAPIDQWLSLLLILLFAFSGWEDTLMPSGEVKSPRKTIPFALCLGLLICVIIYSLFQFAVYRALGNTASDRAVADAAAQIFGGSGANFVAIAIMLSTYGWISGAFLNATRFPFALAQAGDGPLTIGKLNPRFGTPIRSIVIYGVLVFVLGLSGRYLWVVAISAGAETVYYAAGCAALLKLRRTDPNADAFRLPMGRVFAVAGIMISLALITTLDARQIGLMSITSAIAAANWLWARSTMRRRRDLLTAA